MGTIPWLMDVHADGTRFDCQEFFRRFRKNAERGCRRSGLRVASKIHSIFPCGGDRSARGLWENDWLAFGARRQWQGDDGSGRGVEQSQAAGNK